MDNGAGRVPARVGNGAHQHAAYWDKVRTLVWPAPTRMALSWLIAITRKSLNLSPTNSVLPLIMADGRLGLKIIACNRSGAGLGGAGAVKAGALVASLSWMSASGSAVAADAASPTTGATVPVAGDRGEVGSLTGAGWAAGEDAGVIAWGTRAVRAWTSEGAAAPRIRVNCQTKRRARSATAASAAGSSKPSPCRALSCVGSTGRNGRWDDGGGGACSCACLARRNASLIRLMR
jgi:hypothetical protein